MFIKYQLINQSISKFDQAGFLILGLVLCYMILKMAETSVVKSRPSDPYGANFSFFVVFCKSVMLLLQVGHYHHPEPKVELREVEVLEEADEPDHRTAPVHLRHMLSHAQWHHVLSSRAVTTDVAETSVSSQPRQETHISSIKISKSVSFAKVESILGGE